MSDFYDEEMQAEDRKAEIEAGRIITKEEARKAYYDGLSAASHMARLKGYKRMTKPMKDDYNRWSRIESDSRTILARFFQQD